VPLQMKGVKQALMSVNGQPERCNPFCYLKASNSLQPTTVNAIGNSERD
jgi:hypothetical protein